MKMFSFALWVNFNFLNFSKINCAKCSSKCKTNFHLFVRTLPPSPLLSVFLSVLPSLAHCRFLCRRSLCYCILEMHICHLCTKSIAMLWILMLYMNTRLARYMACTHTYISYTCYIFYIQINIIVCGGAKCGFSVRLLLYFFCIFCSNGTCGRQRGRRAAREEGVGGMQWTCC